MGALVGGDRGGWWSIDSSLLTSSHTQGGRPMDGLQCFSQVILAIGEDR